MTPEEIEVIRLINAYRLGQRLTTVSPLPRLAHIARRHSISMKDGHFIDHRGFERRVGPGWQAAGEVLARFPLAIDRPAEVVKGWRESPPHRKTISGDFHFIGVARAVDTKDAWWTAVLAR